MCTDSNLTPITLKSLKDSIDKLSAAFEKMGKRLTDLEDDVQSISRRIAPLLRIHHSPARKQYARKGRKPKERDENGAIVGHDTEYMAYELERALDRTGMTQAQLGALMGVDQSAVSKWLTQASEPDRAIYQKLWDWVEEARSIDLADSKIEQWKNDANDIIRKNNSLKS